MASLTCHGAGGTKQVRLERIVRHVTVERQVPIANVYEMLVV